MDWTWYLFRFDGRINRAKLWLALLVVLLLDDLAGRWSISAIHQPLRRRHTRSISALSTTSSSWSIPAPIGRCRWADLPRLLIKLFGTSLFLWVYFATCDQAAA